LSLRGLNTTIAGGHTSGLQAIAYASDLIAANAAPALIAGGVEELALESYLGFCRAGIICGTNGRAGHLPIPFDADRSGCALAEAAAFVVVEPASAAAARGAHVRAAIAGVASCTDPDALTRGFCESAAIADAIRLALDRAGLMPDEVDAVSSAANGSITADQQEADALAEVFGSGSRRPAVTAMKSVAGETLGASGPLQVIAMCEAIAEGYLPGIAGLHAIADARLTGWISSATRPLPIRTALVTAVSPEGSCSALVLRAAGDGR
jgi:3-oxoacyl-[acyl-carrier-protein] synthase II